MPLNWTYQSPGPVASRFLRSRAFICGIRGPIGGGKSTAAIMKLISNARRQKRQSDGWIRRRTAIIRNTQPELKTTTIPTWQQWLPETIGSWTGGSPTVHHFLDAKNKFEWEVWFFGLDKPKDVRKLLSMELSDAWVNEAREMPKAVIDGLTERVGRYPPRSTGGATDVQLILDTNSMDTDHWWYVLAERDTSSQKNTEVIESMIKAEQELRTLGIIAADQPLMEFFAQPSGTSAAAENTANLRPGYYIFSAAGKTAAHIKVYIHNEYGFVAEGKPVYPEYSDSLHCRPLIAQPRFPLHIGMDFGLTPAALIGQRAFNGRWFGLDELVSERLGVKRFGQELSRKLKSDFPGFTIGSITGDPAGDAGMPDDEEKTVFTVLKNVGIIAKPAHTNDFTVRREAFADRLIQLIDGEPGLVLDPRCVTLRKGLAGGYCFERVAIVGEERFKDKPKKTISSHVCEAGQYMMLGAGEGRVLLRGNNNTNREIVVDTSYPDFG